MDRLAAVIESQTGNRPYVPDTLYLFCGKRTDRIKGLVWEEDGWLLLYKRLSESRFQWPRSPDEVRRLTQQQFRWLMEGLTISPKKSVKPVEPPEYMGWPLCKTEKFPDGICYLPACPVRAGTAMYRCLRDGSGHCTGSRFL